MIITTKNNEFTFIDNDDEFMELIHKEIGEEAKEYYLGTLLKCEEYYSLSIDYDISIDENNRLEKENEELKRKLVMIEGGKETEYFNVSIRNIIRKVRELESVSKSQKVLGLENEIIDRLKSIMLD